MGSLSSSRLTGLQPVFDSHTKILIIGTFPSVASLKHQTYYANERNHFWDILFRCVDADYPPYLPVRDYDREKKYQLLLQHRIGLWDIISSCERKGSNDSKIKNPCFNNLPLFLKNHPHIIKIIFNGMPAFSFFKSSKQIFPSPLSFTLLNSTSTMNPNNTFHVLEEWLNWFSLNSKG